MEYYIFNTLVEAQEALTNINNSSFFPIKAKDKNGVIREDWQATTKWCDTVTELTDGTFAIPRMPNARLVAAGVTEWQKRKFREAFGKNIRLVAEEEIKRIEEF